MLAEEQMVITWPWRNSGCKQNNLMFLDENSQFCDQYDLAILSNQGLSSRTQGCPSFPVIHSKNIMNFNTLAKQIDVKSCNKSAHWKNIILAINYKIKIHINSEVNKFPKLSKLICVLPRPWILIQAITTLKDPFQQQVELLKSCYNNKLWKIPSFSTNIPYSCSNPKNRGTKNADTPCHTIMENKEQPYYLSYLMELVFILPITKPQENNIEE